MPTLRGILALLTAALFGVNVATCACAAGAVPDAADHAAPVAMDHGARHECCSDFAPGPPVGHARHHPTGPCQHCQPAAPSADAPAVSGKVAVVAGGPLLAPVLPAAFASAELNPTPAFPHGDSPPLIDSYGPLLRLHCALIV